MEYCAHGGSDEIENYFKYIQATERIKREEYKEGLQMSLVTIGRSQDGIAAEGRKCVHISHQVTCARDVGNWGKRVNRDRRNRNAEFAITTQGNNDDGWQVCAERIDGRSAEWRTRLQIACLRTGLTGIWMANQWRVHVRQDGDALTGSELTGTNAEGHGSISGPTVSWTWPAGTPWAGSYTGTRDGDTITWENGAQWILEGSMDDWRAVEIGNSGRNKRCVKPIHEVTCEADAGDAGRRINMDYLNTDVPDDFTITEERDAQGRQKICATRQDSSGGWGMQLRIMCTPTDQ